MDSITWAFNLGLALKGHNNNAPSNFYFNSSSEFLKYSYIYRTSHDPNGRAFRGGNHYLETKQHHQNTALWLFMLEVDI